MQNLDSMSIEDLRDFAVLLSTRKGARIYIPDKRKGYTKIALDLSGYASNKLYAMRLRVEGRIDVALKYEKIADKIYNSLPKDLRW